jgi:hypothetical protein
MNIEPLEIRVAPASVLTFTDVDGDKVKVIASSGDLNAAGVATFASVGAGQQLQSLTLAGPSFNGANISTMVTKGPTGDGLVNIGRIDASTHDLGRVTIKGDLGAVLCGDGNAETGPGLKLLSVRSIGIHGTATQAAGGDLFSVVEGAFGTLKVTGDITDGTIGARNFADRSDGKIDSVFVGGSVIGGSGDAAFVINTTSVMGQIIALDDIGTIKIGHDLIGTSGKATGTIQSLGDI